jgi:hypothetical protein
MIAISYITNSLDELEKLYNEATSKKKAIYYSKLATLELCGWVEDTIDNIVIMHANRNLKNKDNKNYAKKQIVNRTYGFQYEKHIRPMLISILGLITLERVEDKFEKNGKITLLKNLLSNLKGSRDKAAHTHLKGSMNNYDAPSLIKGVYGQIKPILIELDAELRANS